MGQRHTPYRSYTPYSGTILVGEHWATGSSPHSGLPGLHAHSTGRCEDEGLLGPSDPPVKWQENTALLSNCGLTGDATTRFPC